MNPVFRQVVYQIFPDRFAIGTPHTPASKLALPVYQQAKFQQREWDEPIVPTNLDAAEQAQFLRQSGRVFYGGDLQGVTDHLDYLQDLGVNTVYFTPLFEAPSNHKYDAITFDHIDPMFGDEQSLKTLLTQLHQRDMGMIMDAAFNHVSNHHPWFLAALRHEEPYKNWFTFEGELPSDQDYHCWWGFGHMPELNLQNTELSQSLINTLRQYLDMGIQGWRFDTGQDIGLPFVQTMRRELSDYPQAQLLGELMNYAADWVGPNSFTGVMNYYQRTTLLAWLANKIGSRQAHIALQEGYSDYGHEGSLASWNMLSSHDTPRLKHLLPAWHERQLALVAQFTLPGIPVIYYGEENGMEGAGDPDCRRPMIWEESRWDQQTRNFYKTLIEIRQNHPALWHGRLTIVGDRLDNGDALIYLRHTGQPGESALIVLNRGNETLDQHALLPDSHLYSTVVLHDALNNAAPIKVDGGLIHLNVPANSAAIFIPQEPTQRYRYFKERNRIKTK